MRPQAARFRLDTTSLRGMFNQQIHGSKRSLRSVEDFTEFEQRTAYFNGDHVSATRKGVHLPDRPNQVAMMAQMQNIIDFPPAPKLDPFGRLDPDARRPSRSWPASRCSSARAAAPTATSPQTAFMDNNMHDLKLERFYEIGQTVNDLVTLPDGADQDLHAARHQGLAALPARRPAADARRHRRVLQPRARAEADAGREGFARGLHAGAVRRNA